MTRLPFLKIVLTGIVCAGLAVACGGGGQTNPPVFTPAGPRSEATGMAAPVATQPARPSPPPTQAPAAEQPTRAPATAEPTAAVADPRSTATGTTSTAAPQGDPSGEALVQSLQQLDATLNTADTVDDVLGDKGDVISQSLQQLDGALAGTDTVSDLNP